MSAKHPYNIHLRVKNIGPHSNSTLPICMGEKGPFKLAVFATNGSGKTSLSRQFRLLSLQNDLGKNDQLPHSEKYITLGETEGLFKMTLYREGDSEKHEIEIKHKNGSSPTIYKKSSLIFHVFNSDYVKDTIEPKNFSVDNNDSRLDGYIIGKSVIDLSKEKKEVESYDKEIEKHKGEIENLISRAKESLRNLGVRTNTSTFLSINFDFILNGSDVHESESFDNLKSSLSKLKSIPDDLPDIPNIKIFSFDFIRFKDLISDLDQKISPSSIAEEFKNKVKNKEGFIESGISIIQKEPSSQCPFCEQKLNHAELTLIDAYLEYFEDQETQYRQKIRSYKKLFESLHQEIRNKHNEINKVSVLYNKMKSFFPSLQSTEIDIPSDIISESNWEKIENYLDFKIELPSQPIEASKLEEIREYLKSLELHTKKTLDKIISDNNQKSKLINSVKSDSQSEMLNLKKRICNASILLIKKQAKQNITSYNELSVRKKELETSIVETEAKVKQLKKTIINETFCNLLRNIFGDKYSFDEHENCLKLKNQLLGRFAQNVLSDGEKSIIAFCYFLAETHRLVNNQEDYDNLFLIVDDPVSSMDFHFIYSISQIVRELEDILKIPSKEQLRLLLLTHNLEFTSILLRNKLLTMGAYSLTNSSVKKLNKEIIMPYQEHLMDIYRVAEKDGVITHTIPNSMRHVLETIKKFEEPGNTFQLDKFISQHDTLRKCSAIYTLIQDGSHGYFRSQIPISDEQVRIGCKSIIQFINEKYKGQIDNIKNSV